MTQSTSHINNAFSDSLDRPLAIGALKVPNRLVQAPMAGVTGNAFRLQARRFGAGLSFTEMISSYGVHYCNRRTMDLLRLRKGEHPVAVQLFGSSPEIMAEAAVAAERAGADVIDINMGCPVRKVVKTGAGVALMANEDLAAEMLAAIVRVVKVPVMAKMRSGISAVTAPSLAVKLQEAGAAAVSIHPRTGAQGWRGRADHGVSTRLAGELEIPVIASGDISAPAEVSRLLSAGVAAVMAGRVTLGNPWAFTDLLLGLKPHPRSLAEVLEEMSRFYVDVKEEMGDSRAVRYMRKFYGWYLGPFVPSGELRSALRRAADFQEAVALARRELGEGRAQPFNP